MLELFAQILLELVCQATGHGVLRAVNRGVWNPSKVSDDAAMIVGLLFWFAILLVCGVCAAFVL